MGSRVAPIEEKTQGTSMTSRVKNLQMKVLSMAKDVKQVGKDDPRKVWHAIKVAIAITLVSLLYYFRPLYDGFGSSTIWAVMTVVVVFEFTVGAALYKCINRGCATLLAGVLGVGAQHLTTLCGETGRPVVLALFIFCFAAFATFLRFFPYLKARFDYGLTIFILTFTMVSVTGYRAEEVITYARTRFLTIVLGVGLVIMISVFVYPVWAGQDLHNLIANNITKLANYLEGFQGEYFRTCEEEKEGCSEGSKRDNKSSLQAYKSVLNSKSTEENLATYARWEPFHSHFRLRHPWKLYLEVGVRVRQVAYQIDALNGYITKENPKALQEFKASIQEPCKKICLESSYALKALSSSIKEMTPPSSAARHIEKARAAVGDLKSVLQDISALEHLHLLAIMPAATVAAILIELVGKMDNIVEAIEELSSKAGFKATKTPKDKSEKQPLPLHHRPTAVMPISTDGDIVIEINELEGKNSNVNKKGDIV